VFVKVTTCPPLRGDVMNVHEGCVIAVGDDEEWIGTDDSDLFDRFRFHIAVT
jgi:hypothetical protein